MGDGRPAAPVVLRPSPWWRRGGGEGELGWNGVSEQQHAAEAMFSAADRAALAGAGWLVASLPAGLTLAGLRAAGAPFKGDRYFARHAAATREQTTIAVEVAYRPALLPGSLGLTYDDAEALMARLAAELAPALVATIAPAAAYVWLFEHHRAAHDAYPFTQRYTWAADRYQERAHLVVGVFGRQRPLLVAPQVEGRGAGVGVWPLVVPRTALPRLWPPAATA